MRLNDMFPQYVYGGPNKTITGKQYREFTVKSTVTCTNANAVYAIADAVATVGGSSIINGTNVLSHLELIITLNDWAAPTGSGSTVGVQLFRTNANDGTSTTGLTIVDSFGMDAPSMARVPANVIGNMSLLRFKISSSQAGAVYNISLRGIYYTP
jgi:hypothetical protein